MMCKTDECQAIVTDLSMLYLIIVIIFSLTNISLLEEFSSFWFILTALIGFKNKTFIPKKIFISTVLLSIVLLL